MFEFCCNKLKTMLHLYTNLSFEKLQLLPAISMNSALCSILSYSQKANTLVIFLRCEKARFVGAPVDLGSPPPLNSPLFFFNCLFSKQGNENMYKTGGSDYTTSKFYQ
jgi:hypothetical protein